MNKTKPVPSSFTHTSLETEGVGAGFAACLRGSACSYLGPSTRLPETWVNLIRHLGLDFISHASFLKHALFSARPAPFPGELQTNLAQLVGNSSRSVKHVTGSAVEGWEGAGVTPGRNPGCAHHPLESGRKAEGNVQLLPDPCHRLCCLTLSMSWSWQDFG